MDSERCVHQSPFTDEYLRQEVDFYGRPAPTNRGGLTIRYIRPQRRCDDYLNVNFHLDPGFDVPALYHSNTLWMSLTWMEVQSLWVPIAMAHGRAATVGLGLGYFALRVLDQVEHLTVYEKDERVIRWFVDTFADRIGDKITFVHGDARELLQNQEFDYLFVDPYGTLCPDEVITDMRLFWGANDIGVYRFWGQELVVWYALGFGLMTPINLTREERRLFAHWQQSEDSKLRSPHLDYEFVDSVVEALSEVDSGLSRELQDLAGGHDLRREQDDCDAVG